VLSEDGVSLMKSQERSAGKWMKKAIGTSLGIRSKSKPKILSEFGEFKNIHAINHKKKSFKGKL